MNLKKEVVDVVHQRLLKLRNIETLVSSREFSKVFEESQNKEAVMRHINAFDVFGIRDWYRTERHKQLGLLGVRELRGIAANLRVLGYNKLPKSLLLSEIVRLQHASASGRNTVQGNANLDSGSGNDGGPN